MGYIRHHAIVVTGSYDSWPATAHAEARRVFGPLDVSDLSVPLVNGYQTFCVWPDGSKEGWDESDAGNDKRGTFIGWLRAQAYEDGSSPLDWVEVQYGDDNLETKIISSGDDDQK